MLLPRTSDWFIDDRLDAINLENTFIRNTVKFVFTIF